MLDIDAVRDEIVAKLPAKYDRLLLTFYGRGAKADGDLIAIGDDYGTTLYLDPRNGHIRGIDHEGRVPTRFVNSSIDQLAQCLAEYERQVTGPKAATDDEVAQMTRGFRAKLQDIDSIVFSDPDNWWACIVEQQEDRQL